MLVALMPAVLTVLLTRVSRSRAGRLVAIGVACLIIGAILFAITAGVSFWTALYWAIVTATTVGYGDVTPKNGLARAVAIGVMLTTIPLFASAFASFAGAVAAAHFRRLLGMPDRDTADNEVVILGEHPSVPRIAQELIKAGRQVVVVASSERFTLPSKVRFLAGDPTNEEMVRRSQPERAGQLLVAGASDADTLVMALLVHQIAPDVPALAVAHSASVCGALQELKIATAVSADDLLAHTLAKSLEAPHAGQLLLRLVDSPGLRLKEVPVENDSVGKKLSSVRSQRAGLVLGAVHDERVVFGLEQDPVLASGDHLLVLDTESS